MKNNNAVLKKEIKDEVVQVLERRLDEKLDIMNKSPKDQDEKNEHHNTEFEHHVTKP